MKISEAINSMNNGKGLKVLTELGLETLKLELRREKKARRIHWKTDVRDEPWAEEIEKRYFAPEHEGKYWQYAEVRVC